MSKSGLYIHIPFCRRKCNYCDFYLITNTNILDRFLINLENEMKILSEQYQMIEFDTIFIGGGTPSLLNSNQINKLLINVNKYFNISGISEITIESNPEDFIDDDNKLTEFRNAGVNRLSLGIQSFIDSELAFLSREHTSAQAIKIVNNSLDIFNNVSIDLIYSLPNQKISELNQTIDKAISLNVHHISAYTLIYEKETPVYNSLIRNQIKNNSDNFESELYNLFSEKLISKGFKHYEISNYAKSGFESMHNLKYWEYENYLGLGPSAHSFHNGVRWNNFRNIINYNIHLQSNLLPTENKHLLTIQEKETEFLMLALRSKGVNLKKYFEAFNENFETKYKKEIRILIDNNYANFYKNIFKLSEKGYSVADEIIVQYF